MKKIQANNPTSYNAQMRKIRRDKIKTFCDNAAFWVNLMLFWLLVVGIVHSCQRGAL